MPDITNQQLLSAMSQQFSVITDAMATKDDLKELGDDRRSDFNKLGARFEDLDHKFDTALEAIDKDLKLKRRIDSHSRKISRLETDSKLYKLAIKQLSTK